MNIVTLDFETYFDPEYTLKKLTTEAYVRDARFEVQGVGLRVPEWGGAKLHYAAGWQEAKYALRCLDWENTAFLCHHAQFDGFILSFCYGARPRFWFDTMSMARLVLGPTHSVALAALCKTFQLSGGKTLDYNRMSGYHYGQDPEFDRAVASGCLDDVRLTWELFQKLLHARDPEPFPEEELRIIDTTIRWFTEPAIIGDEPHYQWVKEKEWLTKNEQMHELGVTEKQLGSAEQFADLLRAEAVEVEMKNGKRGPIPAFAKTDAFMQSLLGHDNPRIVQLAEARLSIKSSIEETRAGRLAGMAQRGPMPVYLNYCGAGNTLRWSGGDGVNWQNLKRVGELRKGLLAPDGHLFGAVDKSQVECRFLEYLAGEKDAIEEFRQGADPYIGIASQFYGRNITKADAPERGMGKQIRLSCGYGAGGASIVATAKRGSYGPPVILSLEEGKRAANLYRASRPGVVDFWRQADTALAMLANGTEDRRWKGVLRIKGNRLIGPNGAYIVYHLEFDEERQSWMRRTRDGWSHVWGGTLVQNVMEFLCRIDLAQGLLRLQKLGIDSVGTVHDEAWFLHPRSEADARHLACIHELARAPDWLPGIPLSAEGTLGERYSK